MIRSGSGGLDVKDEILAASGHGTDNTEDTYINNIWSQGF